MLRLSVLVVLLSMKSTNALSSNADGKMRILCLHGKMQSAKSFSNKIAGARRKLERVYDLHFLNGPIVLGNKPSDDTSGVGESLYAWWNRDASTGQHTQVREAFDYIQEQTADQNYDAILGFSQGGTLATALVLSGIMPGVRAVVTSGAPHVNEVFQVASELSATNVVAGSNNEVTLSNMNSNSVFCEGKAIPKFHFAGERDELVTMDSTRALSENGGNGLLEVHEQGHLFPTRALRVNQVLRFLEEALPTKDNKN